MSVGEYFVEDLDESFPSKFLAVSRLNEARQKTIVDGGIDNLSGPLPAVIDTAQGCVPQDHGYEWEVLDRVLPNGVHGKLRKSCAEFGSPNEAGRVGGDLFIHAFVVLQTILGRNEIGGQPEIDAWKELE